MPLGTIKRLDNCRGFGFIEADTGDVFFHSTNVEDEEFANLCEGQDVEFMVDIADQPKGVGPRAARVVPLRTAAV